jgi:nickel-dependent lactate racemase
LVRACVKEATGKDPGNFTTANEKGMLMATGLFDSIVYKTGTKICTGDILVTKTKGHTVICTEGNKRTGSVSYFQKCSSGHNSLVDALKEVKADTSKEYRAKIALKNGILMYNGSASQNLKLLRLIKDGKLLKP